MTPFKGESLNVADYNTHEQVIYDYYVKCVEECKQQIKETNQQIAEQRKKNSDEKSADMRVLKNKRNRLRYQLVRYTDFLSKHLYCLDDEDEDRVWKDLHIKNIL